MPVTVPAAEAACLPRLAIEKRVACLALFGYANGVMLLEGGPRPTKEIKGPSLSSVFVLDRSLTLASGDNAFRLGLAALTLEPAAVAARDVARLPCAEGARARSSSGPERTFGPCTLTSSATCWRNDLEMSARPWVP